MMQVLLLTDADVFAGTERHVLDLGMSLRGVGASPLIGCPMPSPLADRGAAAGVRVVAIAKRRLPDVPAILALRGLLRAGEVDVIHTHNGRTTLIAAVARALAGVGLLVATQHFLEPSRVHRRGLRAMVSRLLHGWVRRQVDQVIAISNAVSGAALARGDAAADDITVVHNGIGDIDIAALATPTAVRDSLGIPASAPLVACAARLEVEKDVATLVDAMATVSKSYHSAVCVVAGGGALHGELNERIVRLGLANSTRLLGFRPDVLSIVHAADVFVLPSPAEPFGLVLLEAMALSKPVVATRAGGPLEIVEDEVTGLLVTPKDPSAMAGAIVRLLGDRELRERMGRRGRERYLAHFTADRMAAATAAVYRKVLGQAGTAELIEGRPASHVG